MNTRAVSTSSRQTEQVGSKCYDLAHSHDWKCTMSSSDDLEPAKRLGCVIPASELCRCRFCRTQQPWSSSCPPPAGLVAFLTTFLAAGACIEKHPSGMPNAACHVHIGQRNQRVCLKQQRFLIAVEALDGAEWVQPALIGFRFEYHLATDGSWGLLSTTLRRRHCNCSSDGVVYLLYKLKTPEWGTICHTACL